MVKCKVIEEFTLEKFDELKNIVRKSKEEKGRLFVGDIFECNEDMAKYLTGDNPINKVVVKVIEIIPGEEIQKAIKKAVEETTEKRTTKKTTKRIEENR